MDDATSSGHPLDPTGTGDMRSASGVSVSQRAFFDIGERLKAFVGVRTKRQTRISRWVGLWSVVVQKQERIQVWQGSGWKRTLGQQFRNRLFVGGNEMEKLGCRHMGGAQS